MENHPDAFRKDIARFRDYLIVLAEINLSPALRARISSSGSDIVQETLLKAHQHLDQFRGNTEAELAGWLRRILLRELINRLREIQSRPHVVSIDLPLMDDASASTRRLERWLATEEADPSRSMMHEEQLLLLAQAVALLPEEQRNAVELKHLQGWSVAEIGQFTGKSEAAVAGLLRRGLQRLREVLKDEE